MMLRTLCCFALGASALAVPAQAAIDIEQVAISAGPETLMSGGVDYFIEIDVRGTGLSGIDLTLPDGLTTLPLQEIVAGLWELSDSGYSNLAEIDFFIGFGTYRLDFQGTTGDSDSISFFFDPGSSDPFNGFLAPIRPADFEFVSPGPAFRWLCSGICGDVTFVTLDNRLGNEALFEDPTISAWQPGPFAPGARTFGLSTFGLTVGPEPRGTDGGDSVLFFSGFESFREVPFSAIGAPELRLTRDPGSTEVTLSWTGTSGNDEVFRSTDALTLLDSQLLTTASNQAVDDPAGLGDLVFYRVLD